MANAQKKSNFFLRRWECVSKKFPISHWATVCLLTTDKARLFTEPFGLICKKSSSNAAVAFVFKNNPFGRHRQQQMPSPPTVIPWSQKRPRIIWCFSEPFDPIYIQKRAVKCKMIAFLSRPPRLLGTPVKRRNPRAEWDDNVPWCQVCHGLPSWVNLKQIRASIFHCAMPYLS